MLQLTPRVSRAMDFPKSASMSCNHSTQRNAESCNSSYKIERRRDATNKRQQIESRTELSSLQAAKAGVFQEDSMYLLCMNPPRIRHPIIPDIPSNEPQMHDLGIHYWTFRLLLAKANVAHPGIVEPSCARPQPSRSLSSCTPPIA